MPSATVATLQRPSRPAKVHGKHMHMSEPAMAASERIVVLATKSEKARIARRAKALDVSVGEYLRLAEQSFDPDQIEAIRVLAHQASAGADALVAFAAENFATIDASQRRTRDLLAAPSPLEAFL